MRLAAERVGAAARVAGGVAPAPAEEPETARHGDGHPFPLGVQAVDLVVGVDPGDGEHHDEHRKGAENDAEKDLDEASGVELHGGAAQSAHSTTCCAHSAKSVRARR